MNNLSTSDELLKKMNELKPNRLEKIKYFFISKYFFIKLDYTKIHFFDYVCAFFKAIVRLLPYFFYMGFFGLSIYFTAKGQDMFSFVPSYSVDALETISFTLYGLQLTVFSIVVALKHKKVFKETEFKMLSNLYYHGYSIKVLMLVCNSYLINLIIDIALGGNIKQSTVIFGFFSVILLIRVTHLMFVSTAKLHFLYNSSGLKDNYFLRKKGNITSIIDLKNEKEIDYVEELLNKSKYHILDNVQIYFDKLIRSAFYGNNNEYNYDIELFEVYLRNYYKYISNDSQILGTIYVDLIMINMLNVLYKRKMYEDFYEYSKISLNLYLSFLKRRMIRKRFYDIPQKVYKSDIRNGGKFTNIYLRNMIFISVFERKSRDLRQTILTKLKNQKIFLEQDYDEISSLLDTIDKKIENYKNITEKGHSYEKEAYAEQEKEIIILAEKFKSLVSNTDLTTSENGSI